MLFMPLRIYRWHLEPNYNGLSEEQLVNLGPQAHSMQHERVLATSSTLAARLARFGKAPRQRGNGGNGWDSNFHWATKRVPGWGHFPSVFHGPNMTQ